MKHERPCSLRTSRPQPCRKRRKAPRLNPAGRSVGLDPFRLSSGLKISRAMGGNVSDRGSEQEQQEEKNSRGKIHFLTGTAFAIVRFSVLPHTVFHFGASRFLLGTPPGKCEQSDRKFSNFRPADVRFVDRNSSRFHLGIKRFSDQAETGFRLPGLPVPVARISGSTDRVFGSGSPYFRCQATGISAYPDSHAVLCRPHKRFSSPPVIRNRMEAVLHTAPSCQRAALSGLSSRVRRCASHTSRKGKKP